MFTSQNHKSLKRDRTALLFLAVYASIAGIGAIAAIMPPPVYAATAETPRTTMVRYGDLDLASNHGIVKLRQRINRAAKRVCELDGILDVMQSQKVRNCIDQARATAWVTAKQKISKYRMAVRANN